MMRIRARAAALGVACSAFGAGGCGVYADFWSTAFPMAPSPSSAAASAGAAAAGFSTAPMAPRADFYGFPFIAAITDDPSDTTPGQLGPDAPR
jgi:hypothetical protein